MRRLLILAVLAISSLGVITTAVAQDVPKPVCADIFNGDFFYNPNGFVVFNFETHEPSCKSVTYTLFVEVDPGNVVSSSMRGDGSATLQLISPTFDGTNSEVCAWVTSSRGGKDGQNQLFDRAPDSGCVTLVPGGTGGGPSHG